MNGKNVLKFAGLCIVAGLTLAVVGCSAEAILAPNDSADIMEAAVKEQPRDAQSADFSMDGTVLAFDAEKSWMVLSSAAESDRSETPVKYELIIGKNAVVVLFDRSEVAFDAGYITIGRHLIVSGRIDHEEMMVVERIDLRPIQSTDVVSSSVD